MAMPRFCVNTKAQSTGEHEVHNLDAGCDHLPDPQHQRPLGGHPDCHSAVAMAATFYVDVDGCFYCARACHTR
jgi:hypothetical protein